MEKLKKGEVFMRGDPVLVTTSVDYKDGMWMNVNVNFCSKTASCQAHTEDARMISSNEVAPGGACAGLLGEFVTCTYYGL